MTATKKTETKAPAKAKTEPTMAKAVEEPGRNDGTNVTHTAGHGVTEAKPDTEASDKAVAAEPRVVEVEGNPPIVVTDANVGDVPEDMPPGPVEGREGLQTGFPGSVVVGRTPNMAGGMPAPVAGLGALRDPIEKEHPNEPPIGIVDRTLTEAGKAVGVVHGVISHDLRAVGIHPTGLPYMRCPECGNVNISLHTKDRTQAMCPACGWDTRSGDNDGNPPGKVPGVHEVDGALTDAGEIPKGKLEGALGMDPMEAKEGVFVKDMDRPVTVGHVGDDGERIGQSNVSLPDASLPTEDDLPEGQMAGNVVVPEVVREVPKGGDMTTTKNRKS